MSVQLAPPMNFLGIGLNGQVLAGGKLFTYAAGTVTPLATFPDSTQTTPNTNPVILDPSGQASVWLDVTLKYKFVLQDANGNQQKTQDQISGALSNTSLTLGTPASGSVLTVNGAPTGANVGDVTINTVEGVGLGVLSSTAPFSQIFIKNTLNNSTSFAEMALGADGSTNNFFMIMTGSAHSGGTSATLGTFGAVPINILANGVGGINISTAGNITIAAPTSGQALLIQGLAGVNNYAQIIHAPNTTGQSNGLQIIAGTNASDVALGIASPAGPAFFTIFGNGNTIVNQGLGVYGNTPPAQVPGWGTPVGGTAVANYNITDAGGANSNTNKAVAEIIAYLKSRGDFAT